MSTSQPAFRGPMKPRRATFSLVESTGNHHAHGALGIGVVPEEVTMDDGQLGIHSPPNELSDADGAASTGTDGADNDIATQPMRVASSSSLGMRGRVASPGVGPPGFTPAAVRHPIPASQGGSSGASGSASVPSSPLSSTFNHLLLKPIERSSLAPYAVPPSPSKLAMMYNSASPTDWDASVASPARSSPGWGSNITNGVPIVPRSPISPGADAVMQSASGIEGLIRPGRIMTSLSQSSMSANAAMISAGALSPTGLQTSMSYTASSYHHESAAPLNRTFQNISPVPILSTTSLTSPSSPQPCRTVYLGNLPPNTSPSTILDRVKCGPIEAYRTLPEKGCAFIAFLNPNDAAVFHREMTQLAAQHKFLIDGQEVRVAWGKPSPVPTQVLREVTEHNASRNVFFGDLVPGADTEERIRAACERFGVVEHVRSLPDKRIAFVHLCNLADASKAVRELAHDRDWQGRRINYGRDRCAAIDRAASATPGAIVTAPMTTGLRDSGAVSPFPSLAASLAASLSSGGTASTGPPGYVFRSNPPSRKHSEAVAPPAEFVMPQPKSSVPPPSVATPAPPMTPAPPSASAAEKEAIVQRFAAMAIKAGLPADQAMLMARQAVDGSEPLSPVSASTTPAPPTYTAQTPLSARIEELQRQHTSGITGYSDPNAMSDPHASLMSSLSMSSQMGGVMDGPGQQRTVYLGNLHPETTMEELCNVIRGGALEQIKILVDRGIAFVTFMEENSAAHFLARVQRDGMTVRHRKLKIGWGRPAPPLAPEVRQALQFHNASRNVYLGGLLDPNTLSAIGRAADEWSIERIRHDFEEYGEIEMVNRPGGMDCAFVNFTKVQSAIRAVDDMKKNPRPAYNGLRVNFGKDRCANAPRHNSSASMSTRSMTPAGMSPGMSIDSWMMRAGTADPSLGSTMSSSAHRFRLLEQELATTSPAPGPMMQSASVGGGATHPLSLNGRPLRQGQSVGGSVPSLGGQGVQGQPGAPAGSWRSGSRYSQLRKDSGASSTGPPPGVPAPAGARAGNGCSW